MEKILVLNPGSTSTKIAVFDGETPLFVESLTHSAEELAPFDRVVEQYDFRRQLVLDCLARHDFDVRELNAVVSRGGLLAHLGTTDCREVEQRIESGDAHAKLIYDAMALNVAKFIGKTAPGVCGNVDAILLTGGITYSDYIDEEIRRRVSFIAPVIVYPGEDEMQSLALGCLRVLRGEETARTYVKTE